MVAHGFWTGTGYDGIEGVATCDNWTTRLAGGVLGYFNKKDGDWVRYATTVCSADNKIYCFESPTTTTSTTLP